MFFLSALPHSLLTSLSLSVCLCVSLSLSLCLCLSLCVSLRYEHTFELYSDSERLYLFGTDDPESHREWVKSITKVTADTCIITYLDVFERSRKSTQCVI